MKIFICFFVLITLTFAGVLGCIVDSSVEICIKDGSPYDQPLSRSVERGDFDDDFYNGVSICLKEFPAEILVNKSLACYGPCPCQISCQD